MLTPYQSDQPGIGGVLDELATRMEVAGMTEEVAKSWAKKVRDVINQLEPNPIMILLNRVAETNERQTIELESFKRQLYQQMASDEANKKNRN